jgi:hypothetical protein
VDGHEIPEGGSDSGALLQASNLLRALKQNREASALGLLEVKALMSRAALAGRDQHDVNASGEVDGV